jgi:hypothetical protein
MSFFKKKKQEDEEQTNKTYFTAGKAFSVLTSIEKGEEVCK